jgi:hypothetical protein
LRTGGYGSVIGSPAKWNFDITAANCSDVIYFTVDQTGQTTAPRRANVIAITNPYAICPGNATGQTPTVKFALALPYGTQTSPVLSLDGNVLYVIESRPSANGGPILHAINVNNITSTPGSYDFGTLTWTSVHTLAAPTGLPTSEQLFELTFAGITNTSSSPYLDYENDQIFFGDTGGRVRRVRKVSTTSAAIDATTFPVACGANALTSPVFYNDQVIVTSANGRLYRIDISGGGPYTCIASEQGGSGAGVAGGLSAPVIDVTNSKILVTTNDDAFVGMQAIGIFNLMFAANESYVSAQLIGGGSNFAPQTATFDEAFWSTNNGNVYAVGRSTFGGNGTMLVRLPYNGATIGAPAGYATLTRSGGGAATVATSPVTEFLTAAATNPDYLYVGGGGGTYLFLNRISAGFNGTSNAPVAMAGSFAVPGGVTSGIIIDTRTTSMTGLTALSNVYFGTIGIASTTQSTIVQVAQAF